MAHKKGAGSTDNGRDSKSKRLGVKLFGGQAATAGNIIVRQRGTKYHPGDNVYMGKDFTLHAAVDGTIAFQKRRSNRTFVNVLPFDEVEETVAPVETAKKAKPAAEKAAPAKEEKKEKKATPSESITPVDETEAVPTDEARDSVTRPGEDLNKIATPDEEVEQRVVSAPVEEANEAIAETEEPAAEKKPATKKAKTDDLKIIEGVGPKIESLMKEAGFKTLDDVAAASYEDLKKVLDDAGSRYQMHDPTTWPRQAELAAAGKMEELKKYQDELDGGRVPEESDEEE